jgi:glycine/D-amino acid oxidase-like deaminating enzyme
MSYSSLSLWHEQVAHDLVPRAALCEADLREKWDVVIAGAGYTGLWCALQLTELDPNLRVLVLEKHIAGYGASGRNGGWVSALFPTETPALIRRHGHDATVALRRAIEQTIVAIGQWATKLGIDADFVQGGTTVLARSGIELARAREHFHTTQKLGIDHLEWREPEHTLQSPKTRAATWTKHCGRVHPAKLVRGLARAVEQRGVVIRENSPVLSMRPGAVMTGQGKIIAPVIVDALEAYRAPLKESRRATLPLYSLMIATEPLADSVFDDIGLEHGQTFSDYRRLIIYGQRTADNRVVFGGRGAPYHFASSIRPEYDRVDRVFDHLGHTLRDLFPQLATARITHRWGGPLGIPRDWHARVVFDSTTGMGRAGGYVGDGVSLSHLAGFTLADLILGRDTERTSSALVDRRWPLWEPEPLRYLGATAGVLGTGLADTLEARSGKPSLIGRIIDPLTGG